MTNYRRIINDHMKEQEKLLLARLCRDYINLGNRIREVAARVYPDIDPNLTKVEAYTRIGAL